MNLRLFWLMTLVTLPLEAKELNPETEAAATMPSKSLRSRSQHLDVHLGETIPATIALGQINRIVLPFDRPEIRTLNPSTAEIQGHVLYIAPIEPAQINLYVTNADDPEMAIALSLMPQAIPPRELWLNLIGDPVIQDPKITPGRRESVESREETAGFNETTRQLLKTLAMGQIPEGYRFRNPAPNESIRCRQKHVLIQTRQIFEGRDHQVRVGVLRNNGKSPLTLDEESCTGLASIQAIATYPSGTVEVGHEAEIFVVIRPEHSLATRNRPLLIAKRP